MRNARIAIAALAALALYIAPLVAQADQAAQAGPTVSEKKDVAIFALGYYGFGIPIEALGSIDQEIQKVFVDLGRFNIIGRKPEACPPRAWTQFIDTIKKAKEANFDDAGQVPVRRGDPYRGRVQQAARRLHRGRARRLRVQHRLQ